MIVGTKLYTGSFQYNYVPFHVFSLIGLSGTSEEYGSVGENESYQYQNQYQHK